jgi:hypothetical protein
LFLSSITAVSDTHRKIDLTVVFFPELELFGKIDVPVLFVIRDVFLGFADRSETL